MRTSNNFLKVALLFSLVSFFGVLHCLPAHALAPSSHTEEAWVAMMVQDVQGKDEPAIQTILEKCSNAQLGALAFCDAPGLNNTMRQIALHVLVQREDSGELGRRFVQKALELLPQGPDGWEALNQFARLPLYWKFAPKPPPLIDQMLGARLSVDAHRSIATQRMFQSLLLAMVSKFPKDLVDKEYKRYFSHLGIMEIKVSDWFHHVVLVDTILVKGQRPHAQDPADETMLQGAMGTLLLLTTLSSGLDYPLIDDAAGTALVLNEPLRAAIEAFRGTDENEMKSLADDDGHWKNIQELLQQAIDEGIIRVPVNGYWQEAAQARTTLAALLRTSSSPVVSKRQARDGTRLGVIGKIAPSIVSEANQDEIHKQRADLIHNLTMLAWTLAIGYHQNVRFPPKPAVITQKDERLAELREQFDQRIGAKAYAEAIALGMEILKEGYPGEKFFHALHQCVLAHPSPPEAIEKVVDFLIREWRFEDAEQLLRLGLKTLPQNQDLKDFLIYVLRCTDRPDEAMAMATEVLQQEPTRIRTWTELLRGLEHSHPQLYWDALAEFLRRPVEEKAWRQWMGWAENTLTPHDLSEVIAEYPPDTDPRFQKAAQEESARGRRYSGDPQYYGSPAGRETALRAIGLWDRKFSFDLTETRPAKEIVAQYFTDAAAALQKGNTVEAIDIYKRLVALDRSNAKAWRELGKLYVKMHQLPLANHALTEAMFIHGDPETFEALGHLRLLQGDTREANIYFLDALGPEEDRVSALWPLIQIQLSRGKYDFALHWAKKAIPCAQDPAMQVNILKAVAEIYLAQGMKSLAAQASALADHLPPEEAALQRALRKLRLIEGGEVLKRDFGAATSAASEISL